MSDITEIHCQMHGCPNEGHIACTEDGTVVVACHEHMPECLKVPPDRHTGVDQWGRLFAAILNKRDGVGTQDDVDAAMREAGLL